MNKIWSMFGVLVLVCFSFYYTEQVARFVRRSDPIMQSIMKVAETYEVSSVNAVVDDDTIIPGIRGLKVNIDSSYTNMKRLGKFHESLLVYDEIIPGISTDRQFDKYIVSGNKERESVALVFIAPEVTYVKEAFQLLRDRDISATFFVDGSWVEEKLDLVEDLARNGNQIENIGYEGVYSREKLIWTNNMIESVTKVEPKYCYTKYRNSAVLDLCKSYYMYTVRPSIITASYPFNTIKKGLQKGSIIHLDLTATTIKELPTILSYLKQKGYAVETLSNNLSENKVVDK